MKNYNPNIPIISIITVSYNAENTLENTIQSIINQTYPNIEYIIIDGGSKDKTIDIIKKYEHKISYWVSEPDKGIYNAMNKGIQKASGDWINFMNAGDTFYDSTTISKIKFEQINNSRYRIVYGDTIKKKNNKTFYLRASNILHIKRSIICCHQSLFVSLIDKSQIAFDEKYKISADYQVIHDLYYKFGKSIFYYTSIPISIYDGEFGVSAVNRLTLYKEQLEIRARHKNIMWFFDFIRYKIRVLLNSLNL